MLVTFLYEKIFVYGFLKRTFLFKSVISGVFSEKKISVDDFSLQKVYCRSLFCTNKTPLQIFLYENIIMIFHYKEVIVPDFSIRKDRRWWLYIEKEGDLWWLNCIKILSLKTIYGKWWSLMTFLYKNVIVVDFFLRKHHPE